MDGFDQFPGIFTDWQVTVSHLASPFVFGYENNTFPAAQFSRALVLALRKDWKQLIGFIQGLGCLNFS